MVAELGHLSEWVQVQVNAGMDAKTVGEHQFKSVMSKVEMLHGVDMEGATKLVAKIKEIALPSWSSEQITKLTGAVGDKVCSQAAQKHIIYQECATFERYLTPTEMDKLRSGDLSDKAMIQICKARAAAIGLHTSSETTKGRIANIIWHVSGREHLSAHEWYTFLQKVKKAIATIKASSWKMRSIHKYPENPDDLDPDVYTHAYREERPGMVDLPDMAEPDFLRKTSRRMKEKAPETPQHKVQPAVASASFDPSMYAMMYGHHIANAMFQHSIQAGMGHVGGAVPQQTSRATASPSQHSQAWSPPDGVQPKQPQDKTVAPDQEAATDHPEVVDDKPKGGDPDEVLDCPTRRTN